MRRKALSVVLATPLAFSLYVLAAGCTNSNNDDVEGDPASCGNIDVSAQASCTVEVDPIACEAQCTPVNFRAECNGRCGGSFSAECTGSCEAECQGSCEVDPPSFECQGGCEADCNAGCSGHCEAEANQAECQGQCEASCTGQCEASCEGTPGSATCEGKCQAACEGSCTIESDFECNIDCQAELQGGCEVGCSGGDGSLFCDGSYVDTGNNMAECIAWLNTVLTVEVDANGSAACEGNACTAEGTASCSASVAPHPVSAGAGWLGAGLAALGLAVVRRRRRG